MKFYTLLTGASRGIGKAIAAHLLSQGIPLIGVARQFLSADLEAMEKVCCDLADRPQVDSLIKDLNNRFPLIDTAICNAGRGLFGNLEELSPEAIQETMQVNFISHVLLIKSLLPHMKRRGRGRILLIGSEAALQGKRKGSIYCASKFALRGFAQALREECMGSGVQVTLIHPGMVQTSFFDQEFFKPGEHEEEHLLAADVVQAVDYALSLRSGANLDELYLSPQKPTVRFVPTANQKCLNQMK